MMTIDDEGEGGVWPMMTSSQTSKILGKFLGFHREFHQNVPKIFSKFSNSGQNFSSKF